jgi:hypothetical protein
MKVRCVTSQLRHRPVRSDTWRRGSERLLALVSVRKFWEENYVFLSVQSKIDYCYCMCKLGPCRA